MNIDLDSDDLLRTSVAFKSLTNKSDATQALETVKQLKQRRETVERNKYCSDTRFAEELNAGEQAVD